MPPAVLTEQPEDAAALRRLLAAAVDPWASQDELARVLGVARSAISQWLSGARAVAWHVVRASLRRTARRHPEAVPAMVACLAYEVLDAHGRWVPEEQLELLDFADSSGRVTVAHARLLEAVAGGDAELVARCRRQFIEASEACAAAAARRCA